MVTPRFFPHIGGVEHHVGELAERFAAGDHDVTILTHRTDPSSPATEERDGVQIRRFQQVIPSARYPFSPALLIAARQEVKRRPIMHIHHYHAVSSLAGFWAPGSLTVFTPHYHGTGHDLLSKTMHVPFRVLGRKLFDHAGRVICVSHAEKSLISRDFPGALTKLDVIPNGVHVQELRDGSVRDDLASDVVIFGRLEPYKNVAAVIRAAGNLPGVSVSVIGEGPDRARLEQLAAVAAPGRVGFLGHVSRSELVGRLCSARVVVSMSRLEAFGIGVLEAAIAGAYVVASDIPSHREILEDIGAAHTLIPLWSTEDYLSRQMNEALDLRGGVSGSVERYDWECIAELTLHSYRSSG